MKKVDNFTDLKEIRAVSWSVRENADGECQFGSERTSVRFEDNADQYWELCVYFIGWSDVMQEYQEYIAGKVLNSIFHMTLGILLGKWIGYNCTLSEAVNQARKELHKESAEEGRYFLQKEYIF